MVTMKPFNHDLLLTVGVTLSIVSVGVAVVWAFVLNENMGPQGTSVRFHLHGHFILNAFHANHRLFGHVEKDNLIVTNGFQSIGHLVFGSNSGVSNQFQFRYVAVGSSGTAPAIGDTHLGSECAYTRGFTATPTYVAGVNTLKGTFVGQVCNTQEVGIFDASTGGNMLSHQTFASLNLGVGDTLVVTYTITES